MIKKRDKKIAVTAKMIKAGRLELFSWQFSDDAACMAAVYTAMEEERRKAFRGKSRPLLRLKQSA